VQYNFYREDIKKAVTRPPLETKFIFTLIPEGKLVDGSEGKELTFTRQLDPTLTGLSNDLLHDIPLGVYTIRGEQVAPDGTRKPLLIQQAFDKFGDSTKVEFAPGSSTGAWPAPVGFTTAE
jgi:hypothetical protein